MGCICCLVDGQLLWGGWEFAVGVGIDVGWGNLLWRWAFLSGEWGNLLWEKGCKSHTCTCVRTHDAI